MATTQIEHEGLWISITTTEVKGGWVSEYQIGIAPIRRCHDRPIPSEEIAFSDAKRNAEREIEHAKQLPNGLERFGPQA